MPAPSDLASFYLAIFTASIVLLGFAGAIMALFSTLFATTREAKHFTSKILTIVASGFMLASAVASLGEAWYQATDWFSETAPVILFFAAAILIVLLLWRATDAKMVPGSGFSGGGETEVAPSQPDSPKRVSKKSKKAPRPAASEELSP